MVNAGILDTQAELLEGGLQGFEGVFGRRGISVRCLGSQFKLVDGFLEEGFGLGEARTGHIESALCAQGFEGELLFRAEAF